MLKKVIVAALTISTLTAAGCASPAVDETYCQDVTDAQKAIQQYGDIDRASASNEIMEDLNEMGANNRCPGFDPAGADKDG